MSRFYIISMTLDFQCTRENKQFSLQKASDFGFVYLADNEDKKLFNINVIYLTVEQALSKILMMTDNKYEYGQPFLQAKYQDTNFLFWLYEVKNGLIEIAIGAFGNRWDKKFEYDKGSVESIDFARYIRLLLRIYFNITLLKLETFSDITNNINYNNQGCITAVIWMGKFKKEFINNLEDIKKNFIGLINNCFINKFIFFNEITKEPIKPSVDECYESFIADFSAYLHAKKNDIAFKFEIKRDAQQGFDFVSIYPLEPYLMKKGYGSEAEKIDVAFYIERLLELCENFAIYELQTFL